MSTLRVAHYDLHCHSTRSDGTMPPADLVARAAQRGVRALALTDHDEVSGLAEARLAAQACGLDLIDGVEISVTWRGHTVHVVGLLIDPGNPVLVEGLHTNRSGRNERAARMAAELDRVGISGALQGAQAYVTNPELVSRTHFARYLVQTGRVSTMQAAFDRYLGDGKPAYVPHEWTSLERALEWILAAGGLPVLAHPGRYKLTEEARESLLAEFKSLGGVGVEVVTGSHTPDEYGYWAKRAAQFGLLASTGSDFHGGHDVYRDLGELPVLPSGCVPIWSQF
ncbi:MAG: 3',5'-nucleoside bisphosphate phosphatase [Burkholderiales bacterium]